MEKLKAMIALIRPSVCALAVLGFMAGAIVSGIISLVNAVTLLKAILTTFLICSAGNVINDYFDTDIDRVNKPTRPIPSGKIKPCEALTIFTLLLLSGIVVAASISFPFFLLASLNALVAFIYGWKLKRMLIIGNLADSYLASVVFVAPLFLFNQLKAELFSSAAAFMALIAFTGNLGREIMKDAEDVEGDKRSGAKTIPVVFGVRKAMISAYVFIVVGTALATLPIIRDAFNLNRTVYTLLYFPFLLAVGNSFRYSSKPSKAQRWIKMAMFTLILSFIVSSMPLL